MFDVNGVYLDLKTIKFQGPTHKWEYYPGNDEVKKLFARVWRDIDERFLNQHKPVIFKTPSILTMGSGGKEGSRSRGYGFPRSCSINVPNQGKVRIDWYDDKKIEGGRTQYTPVTFKVRQEQKMMVLDEGDIELILAMMIMNPHLAIGNRAGITFLDDPEKDAITYADLEAKNATVAYWLFRPESPFFENENLLRTLAMACGINPDAMSVNLMKQKISESVKAGEKLNNPEINSTAFDRMCQSIRDGSDTSDVELSATVNRAVQLKVIKYIEEEYCWKLLKEDKKTPAKTICRVPPQSGSDKARQILKKHLQTNADDLELIEMSVDTAPMDTKFEVVILSKPLPEPETMTEEIVAEIPWPDMRKLYTYFGEDGTKGSKDQIIPFLVDKLVTQRTKVNFKIR